VLRRHQFGGDWERRGDRTACAKAGQQTDDDQLLGGLHQRDQQGEERRGDDADQHDRLAAPVIRYQRRRKPANAQHKRRADGEQPDVGPRQMQRFFGQHQERAGEHQIVALDEADEGKHGNDQNVVTAERDAVELVPENMSGGYNVWVHRMNFCHGDLPDHRTRRNPRRAPPGRIVAAFK